MKCFASARSRPRAPGPRSALLPLDTDELFGRWRSLAADGVNNRAAAGSLGVTEARLVDSGRGRLSTPLICDAPALFDTAADLGNVKVVVRNDCAVLERPGSLQELQSCARALVLEGPTFRCLVDTAALGSAFALVQGEKRSLELFDRNGVSMLKLILRPESRRAAFDALCSRLVHHAASPPPESPVANGTRNPHGAFEGETVATDALARFLEAAVAAARPVRLSVSSPGATLQVEETLHRIKRSARAPWINVLDPALDLHLFEQRIRRRVDEGGAIHWLADDGGPAFTVGGSLPGKPACG